MPDLYHIRQCVQAMVLVTYLDGTFRLMSETDAYYESGTVPDFVSAIPLTEIQEQIDKVIAA